MRSNVLSELLSELSDLEQLKTDVKKTFNELDTELEPIYNTLKLSNQWKQGLAADAYRAAIDHFYRSYAGKLAHLDLLDVDIANAINDIEARIQAEMMRGPKF